jgi:EAL domain-containing protein (putative c-di-GMP-specific phosphodiesterase class I)
MLILAHPRLRHEEVRRYLREICTRALPLAVVICSVWVGIFVLLGRSDLSLLMASLASIFAACWIVSDRISLVTGMLLAECLCLAVTTMFCLTFDLPTEAVSRSSHSYFLVVAFTGYLEYRRTRVRAQMAVILLALAGFVAFASMPLHFAFAQPIADPVRAVLAWINSGTTVLLLAASLFVLQLQSARTERMARELHLAIGRGELELFYQPQVDRAGTIIGAEGLLRWNHPTRGRLTAAQFIPVAQDAGLMPQLGTWVLTQAARTLSRWQLRSHTYEMVLTVNVSADHFLIADFVEQLVAMVRANGAHTRQLKLELTESVLLDELDVVVGKLTQLQGHGICVALDHFGTGFASLSYLQQLPLQQLNIDRSFTRAVCDGPRPATLARNIIDLGKALNLKVLAEGVETREQFAFMRDGGCDAFQGRLFGEPLPLPAFEALLQTAHDAPVIVSAG